MCWGKSEKKREEIEECEGGIVEGGGLNGDSG